LPVMTCQHHNSIEYISRSDLLQVHQLRKLCPVATVPELPSDT